MDLTQIMRELDVFKTIGFDEKTHTYTWINSKGEPQKAKTSMTTLIHKYVNPFDEQTEAARMSEKLNVPKEEILKEWAFARNYSTTKGTAIHNYLEYLFSNIEPEFMYDVQQVINKFGLDVIAPHWQKLTSMARRFHKMALNHLIPIACELKIKDDETGIAGAIDMLVYNKNEQSLFILDYKSGKEIRKENIYDKYMLPPFDHLPDINHVHYSLQLCGYQYLLEKNTNLKLRNQHFLAWIHEDNDDVILIPTLKLQKEAKMMIEMG